MALASLAADAKLARSAMVASVAASLAATTYDLAPRPDQGRLGRTRRRNDHAVS